MIQEDIRKYKIDIPEEKIAQMDGKSFKNMVKVKVRKQAFKELCEVQKGHIKVQDIKYFGLTEPQEYLKSTSFSNKEQYLLYNLRCRSVNGIKDNFHRLYNNEVSCPFFCPQQIDNQEHILTCATIIAKLSDREKQLLESVSYSHLFGTVTQQLNITNIFLVLLRIRKRLLKIDQQPACEGNNTRPSD